MNLSPCRNLNYFLVFCALASLGVFAKPPVKKPAASQDADAPRYFNVLKKEPCKTPENRHALEFDIMNFIKESGPHEFLAPSDLPSSFKKALLGYEETKRKCWEEIHEGIKTSIKNNEDPKIYKNYHYVTDRIDTLERLRGELAEFEKTSPDLRVFEPLEHRVCDRIYDWGLGSPGVGYEIERAKNGKVKIWRVWPSDEGKPVRVTLTPMLIVDEAAIHPKFFKATQDGNLVSHYDPRDDQTHSADIITPNDHNVTFEMEKRVFITNKSRFARSSNELLLANLDLGCRDWEARKGTKQFPKERPHLTGWEKEKTP